MIRFLPDTLGEAILRPFWMALPNAAIYVEIMAPDLRFAAIVLIAALVAGSKMARRVEGAPAMPRDFAGPVLAFMAASFAVWLYTSGNGRYFLVGLLLAGPVLALLVHRLPVSKTFRILLVLLALVAQAVLVVQVPPWNWWSLAPWGAQGAGFYPVALDDRARTETPTYVLISPNSHSIIAHKFPAGARWVNLTSAPVGSDVPAAQRVRQALSGGGPLNLVLHTAPPELMTAQGQPTPGIIEMIDGTLGPHGLALDEAGACRILPSAGFASQVMRAPGGGESNFGDKVGFWVCPLRRTAPVAELPSSQPPVDVVSAFSAVEARCPRFFPPGQRGASRLPNGWMRVYPGTDLRLYVYDEGGIHYRYWRALNMGTVGTVADALNNPASLSCDRIEGRSGFPGSR